MKKSIFLGWNRFFTSGIVLGVDDRSKCNEDEAIVSLQKKKKEILEV